ncbi:MAG: P1 family peptidase [Ilumatobacter sp.]|nr:P1 family peptidase [Ilumatobacter sp.]
MTSTPAGSITDVTGVAVGHHQRTGRAWQTGTTVVLVTDGATPAVAVRGGGPGTRETDALAPENLVHEVHAVCLTGGSAYGLAAADGVMAWLEQHGLGYPVGPDVGGHQPVVPVVPTAVIFDLGRSGAFANRPDSSFGERAARNARSAQTNWGSVGAGTGATAGGLQGGVGTASTRVRLPLARPVSTEHATTSADSEAGAVEVVVGALAVVNANGSVIDRSTGLPWETGGLRLRRPDRAQRSALADALSGSAALNTTIGVVATSARLSKAEASKMASVAHDGLARAIRPAHSMFDGDTIFGLATGHAELPAGPHRLRAEGSRQHALNAILVAAADTFAAACTHAVVAAAAIGDAPAYRDLCSSALR